MKRDNKVFVIKVVIFVFLFVLIDYSVGGIMMKLENIALEKSGQSYVWHYAMRKANEDIIIVGASEAAHSFVPEILIDSLHMSMFNSGADGTGFYYHNIIINNILERNNPKVVIWTVSPDYLSRPFSNQISHLSDLNSFYNEDEYCFRYLNQQSRFEKIKMLSNAYRYNSKLLLALIYVRHDLKNNVRYVPLYGTSTGIEKNQKTNDENVVDEKTAALFCETIEKCKKKNVRLVLAITPYYSNWDYKNSESFKRMESIVKNTGIELVDSMSDSRFCDNVELFYDNAHLNDDGARKYTSIIAGYLKNHRSQ